MNKTIIKTFFIILLVSLLMLLIIPFISPKIQYITLFSFIGYFYLTLFFFKAFNKRLSANSIVAIIFVTMIVLQLHTIFTWFYFRDLFGLPTVIACFLGVISAHFYFKGRLPKNIAFFFVSCCFVVFMFFQGWGYWVHKIDYGTFTGRIEAYQMQTNFEAFDEQNNLITNNNFQNKIVLLDFWYTRCGICFVKFPQLQTAYEKYKNDSSVMVLAVNKPIEEDKPNQAFNIIREEGHSFPVVITKDKDMAEKFGVKGYPTTLVIDRHGIVVYKGGIEGAVKMVETLKNETS